MQKYIMCSLRQATPVSTANGAPLGKSIPQTGWPEVSGLKMPDEKYLLSLWARGKGRANFWCVFPLV
jgi:hypothetical protein